jgi:hypothetical protein
MRILSIRMDETEEPRFSNARDSLDIVSFNLFPQVVLDEISYLAIGESFVQLYHNLRPPFGLRLWFLRSSLLNFKSFKNSSLLVLN